MVRLTADYVGRWLAERWCLQGKQPCLDNILVVPELDSNCTKPNVRQRHTINNQVYRPNRNKDSGLIGPAPSEFDI